MTASGGAAASAIQDPARLQALSDTGLLDTPAEERFDRVTRLAARILKAPFALLTLVDADRQFFKSAHGLYEQLGNVRETPLDQSLCRFVILDDAPLVVHDLRTHDRSLPVAATSPLNIVAYAGVPLRMDDATVVGTLCVLDERTRLWTSEDLAILHDLAEWVMAEIRLTDELTRREILEGTVRHELMLRIETESHLRHEIEERERLQVILRQQSVQDELTTLHNRRGFFAVAEQQLRLARRNGQCVLMIFADMDNFKAINDTYGHPEGDAALVEAGRVLRESLRECDVLGRVGGDEFAGVILYDCHVAPTPMLARLRHRIASANSAPGRRYPLSLSLGVASFESDSPLSLSERLAVADAALYSEKRARRAELRSPDQQS